MAGPMQKSAEQIAAKWAERLGAATTQITQGVQAVTQSPMEKAAARAQAYLEGVQRAVSSGKYADNLRAVSLSDWKNAMINKGIPIIAQRAQQAKNKFRDFMVEWLSFQASVAAQLQSMPRGTLEQNIQRAVFVMRQAKEFRKGSGVL